MVQEHTGRKRRVGWLLVAGVGLAAINLRTAVTSVGPVLDEITASLGMSGALAGLLTTLPVLCFALFGACTPALARRLGEHRLLLLALIGMTLGLAARAVVSGPAAFLVLSALALSGGAVGNVLLPTLVKRHFPSRVGLMTTVYTTALALGTAMAAAGTVPLTNATGGNWHLALGSYAVFGLIAAVPWLLLLRHEPEKGDPARSLGARHVLRSAMGWQSVVFFGTQSMIAYVMFGWFPQVLRDNGMDAASAGVLLSYLTALAIPTSLVMPSLMARVRDHRGFIIGFFLCYMVGFSGLWLAPVQGAWVWATLIGLGMTSFPLALTMFAVRTRSAPATAALSAVSQSIGYLIAGTGPFLFGLLHEVTGGWRVPIAMLFVVAAANLTVGMFIGRDRYLEDTLSPREAS